MLFTKTPVSAIILSVVTALSAAPALADTTQASTLQVNLPSGDFIKRKKNLKGSWEVIQRDGRSFIAFSDDFRAAGGPDLKVFLSPKPFGDVTGKTATDRALSLGALSKNRGTQEYEIPGNISLTDFGSILVHCEAYAVLWGGSDLH